MSETAKQMSWSFLVLAIILLISVILLLVVLKKELRDHETDSYIDLKKEFRSELIRLFTMLLLFMTTYLIRFAGDYYVVPLLISP